MEQRFTQTMTFHSDQPGALVALAQEWDTLQAGQDVMGYAGLRILADRDTPGRYVMVVNFAVVDPELTAAEEAFINNERAQTQEYADKFRAISKGEPEWHHYDELYSTQD